MDNRAFECSGSGRDVTLEDFVDRRAFQADVLAVLKHPNSRVFIVDFSLWIVSPSSAYVTVLQSNGDFIRRLVIHEPPSLTCAAVTLFTKKLQAVAVTQTLKGEIVVAGQGLHHDALYRFNKGSHLDELGLVCINSDGVIEEVVSQGSFNDVTHDAHCVYGLEQPWSSQTCYRVRSFYTNDRGGWIHVTDTCLQYGASYDRILVRNSVLYLSRTNAPTPTVDQYNQDGILVSSLSSTHSPLHLSTSLCDVDVSGSFLLVDSTTNTLCVLSLDRNWRYVDVINVVEPVSAQMHCGTGIIWIVGKDKRTRTGALFAISVNLLDR